MSSVKGFSGPASEKIKLFFIGHRRRSAFFLMLALDAGLCLPEKPSTHRSDQRRVLSVVMVQSAKLAPTSAQQMTHTELCKGKQALPLVCYRR